MTIPSLTLVTTCKPFQGETELHQRIAIDSWRRLGLEVLVIGKDFGVENICSKYGLRHIPEVRCSERNIPLLDDLFCLAKRYASTSYIAYINADIILDETFLKFATIFIQDRSLPKHRLLTTRRKNIPIVNVIPESAEMTDVLAELELSYGTWDLCDAIDLFLFNIDLFQQIPAFEIGRMQWDNWLLAEAKNRGAAIVDGALSFKVLHPIHDYDAGWKNVINGTATSNNQCLAEGQGMDIDEARTHILVDNKIQKVTPAGLEGLQAATREDPTKELLACLFTIRNSGSLENDNYIDGLVRRLLWRRGLYFPINASVQNFTQLRSILSETMHDINASNCDSVYDCLQDILAVALLKQLYNVQETGRKIALWGTGQFAARALSFFERQRITITYLFDSEEKKPDTYGLQVLGPDNIILLSEKPFVIIASMFVEDISNSLKALEYQEFVDYAH